MKEEGFAVEPGGTASIDARQSSTAVVNNFLISYLLLSCNGDIDTAEGPVPNRPAVTAEFAAYEIANLAPLIFAQVPKADTLELHFTAVPTNRYGKIEQFD